MTDEFQNLFEDNFLEDIKGSSTEKLKDGERRIVSILFADISGFTKLSEKMDHEDVRDMIDKLFKVFTSSVEKHGGYVDKYAGDEIMALFGAKVASEVDTHRSVSCALDMLDKLNKFNSYIINDSVNNLSMRIGINTGMVTTGSIGKGREGDFTVYGKVVNLASRMESNAPLNRIMVPYTVMKQVEKEFRFEDHGKIKVKGFQEEIRVHLVQSKNESEDLLDKVPFIGNQDNLNLLVKMYNDSLNSLEKSSMNDLRGISIKGPAGIGKSRLIEEFIDQVSQGIRTNNIIRARSDNISFSPYKVFISIIKKSLSISLSDSKDVALKKFNEGMNDISHVLDSTLKDQFNNIKARIAYLIGLKIGDDPSNISGQDLKNEIQLSLRIFIEAICAKSNLSNVPFIIIIEDLQWIDEGSLDVLNHIIDIEGMGINKESIHNRALYFIFDYRDNYNLPRTISQIGSFKEILVDSLNREDCYEMIKYTMNEDIIPDEVVSTLLEHSEGNPFFIEEWLKSLGPELKWSINDINSWIASIPSSMHSLILSRVDILDEASKQLLQCASVIGKEFYLDMIKQLKGRVDNLTDISSAIKTLKETNFIFLDKKTNLYMFKHTLTQEVTYDSILKSNKKILHGLLADIIEIHYEQRKEEFVEQLATHYEKSDNISKAKLYLIQAAEKSKKHYNLKQANDFYSRVVRAYIPSDKKIGLFLNEDLKKLDKNEAITILTILYHYAEILMMLGEMDDSQEILLKIKKAFTKDLKNDEIYCAISGTIGKMYFLMGKYDEAELNVKEQLSLSEKLENMDQKFKSLHQLANIMIQRADFDSAEKELNLLKQEFSNDPIKLGNVFSDLGIVNLKRGNLDKALEFYSKSEKIYADKNQKIELLNTLGNMGIVYKSLGKNQEALKIYNKILIINQEIGDKALSSKTHGNKGVVLKNLKKFTEALREYNLQIKICEYSKDKAGIGKANSNSGTVYKEMKEYDNAINCFNRALKISINTGNKREEGIALANLGETFMDNIDLNKSREYLEKSIKIFKDIGDSALEKLVFEDLGKIKNKK